MTKQVCQVYAKLYSALDKFPENKRHTYSDKICRLASKFQINSSRLNAKEIIASIRMKQSQVKDTPGKQLTSEPSVSDTSKQKPEAPQSVGLTNDECIVSIMKTAPSLSREDAEKICSVGAAGDDIKAGASIKLKADTKEDCYSLLSHLPSDQQSQACEALFQSEDDEQVPKSSRTTIRKVSGAKGDTIVTTISPPRNKLTSTGKTIIRSARDNNSHLRILDTFYRTSNTDNIETAANIKSASKNNSYAVINEFNEGKYLPQQSKKLKSASQQKDGIIASIVTNRLDPVGAHAQKYIEYRNQEKAGKKIMSASTSEKPAYLICSDFLLQSKVGGG